jgi:hypothetical protein
MKMTKKPMVKKPAAKPMGMTAKPSATMYQTGGKKMK